MTTTTPPLPEMLCEHDLLRICRDIAWSEISAMPGVSQRLAPRLAPHPEGTPQSPALDWSAAGLALDSLARMSLATAAAVWCNAYDAGFEDLFLAKRNAVDWAGVMKRARQAGARHFTFSSSGSVGARKHIRHQEEHLAHEAQAWAAVLSAGSAAPVRRVIMLAPTHHIYGLIWGVLLPKALGVPVIDADLTALPVLQSGDVIVAVPDQWGWLAKAAVTANSAAPTHLWPAGVVGISSTAPLPPDIHTALTSPLADGSALLERLLQIYGSTETAGLAWRDTPAGDYQLAPGRSRAENGIALTLPGGLRTSLAVQDELQWTSDTHFQLLRRSDQSVQVGGHNVSPAWVADQLRAHPAVTDASVRLDTHASPPRLKAFVVMRSDEASDERVALEAWALDTLPWYAALGSIRYGSEVPRNAMGKLCDWP
jgi:long-chain acyl-CoA synthetase